MPRGSPAAEATCVRVEGERPYEVWIGRGLLREAGTRLRAVGGTPRALIVTVPPVARHWQEPLRASLAAAGVDAAWHVVPDGEESKSLEQLAGIYQAALTARLDRESWIVALGGGVVGDLAGFAAATFLRGVRFLQVPTTLLAQVDASVGGKTGVNLPAGKNLVGAFHWPSLVLADLDTLSTLPEGEFRAGFAEAVKHGLLSDENDYGFIRRAAPRLLRREPAALQRLVADSVRIKAAVVGRDPREAGERRRLNLGHTVGHAIEAAAGYGRWRHGEAVAAGLAAEGALALAVGTGWTAERQRELLELLETLSLPTQLRGLRADELLERMRYDKKAIAGELRWMLPAAPGRIVEVTGVPRDVVRRVLVELGAEEGEDGR
ncbi:MAG: 3-dehydroquinate synthase [Firmicutes bacterium]|nr:3-dehydroquinate synthase [Bacillota bacterium]